MRISYVWTAGCMFFVVAVECFHDTIASIITEEFVTGFIRSCTISCKPISDAKLLSFGEKFSKIIVSALTIKQQTYRPNRAVSFDFNLAKTGGRYSRANWSNFVDCYANVSHSAAQSSCSRGGRIIVPESGPDESAAASGVSLLQPFTFFRFFFRSTTQYKK